MRRRLLTLPAATVVVGIVCALAWPGTAFAGGGPNLSFQVTDARAYGYKASIAQPVIQAAPKCNPKKDKYHCQGYNHRKNCPAKFAFGARRQPNDPQPPAGVDGASGGAGQGAGNDPAGAGVPQSSAVRLNRLLADGSLGRVGNVLTSNGLASLQYVELGTPPWNGFDDAHTETDAFTNQANYEERCYPKGSSAKTNDYAHMFSHSFKRPATLHYTECWRSQCQFPNGPRSPTANHRVSDVHLWENGNVVNGVMSAQLEHLTFFSGKLPFEIDDLQTYATFSSDGSPSGLHWNVSTSAQGVHLGGQPVNLPEGQSIELGTTQEGAAVGLAGPYVDASKAGGDLPI